MTVKYVKLKTLWIRLDQLLKFAGVAESGGQAKEMILGEEVRLNGELCLSRGKKISPAILSRFPVWRLL